MNDQMHKRQDLQAEEGELKFKCPLCGCTEFGMVETGVEAFTPILKVTASGRAEYGKTQHDYEKVEEKCYECARGDYRLEIDGDTISAPDDKLLLECFGLPIVIRKEGSRISRTRRREMNGPTRW